MATKHSGSSTLPLIWVIEALASFKQVDASLLIDLVKRTPDISDDMGKNAREVVSFRILESLFTKSLGTTNNVASLPDSKICFEPSKRCEDVLRLILDKSSGSKLRLSEVEMSKYDIEPFMKHKSSCLPKTDLQQLKDLILQGSHPLLAPLKEKSGLVISNEPENINPIVNGNSIGGTERLEGYDRESQAIAAIRELISLSSGKSPSKNLLPAKRGINSSGIGSIEGKSNENHEIVGNGCGGPHLNHAKKPKRDVTVSQSPVSPQRTELVEAQCGRNSPHTENSFPNDNIQPVPSTDDEVPQDKNGEEKSQNVLGMEEAKEDDIADVANEVRQGKDHANGAEDNCGQNFILNMLDKEKDDEVNEVSQGSDHVNGGKDNCDHNFVPNTSNKTKDDVANNLEPEISSDSDGYNDERTSIATKKHVFLSSQCTYSQDSMTETNLCMKCHKSSNLLFCSTNTCPLVVHEKCLGCGPTFDEQGKFYCPFCACSRARSEYLDLKKKALLARKDLRAFIGSGNESRPSKKLHLSEENQSRKDEKNGADNVTNGNGDDNVHEKEPLVQCNSDNPACGEKGQVLRKDKLEGKKKGRDFIPPLKGNGEVDKSSNEHVAPSITEIEGSSEEENDKSVALNYSFRSRKPEKQYTSYPSIPQLRRKKLVWTKIEEETLKEGVKRFSNANDKNIPWKKILEFGSNVFLKGRTAIDLKDKWRNLCKGSPRPSK